MSVKKKINGVVIILPSGAENVKIKSLDEIFKVNVKRGDYLVAFRLKEYQYLVLLELTGIPEIEDIKRLRRVEEEIRSCGCCGKKINMFTILIVHHKGGVRSPLINCARAEKVELCRCSTEIDLCRLLIKRGILPFSQIE